MKEPSSLADTLPAGVELTLSELEDMAARQQQQIESQQQLLVAKEQRLKFLKQQEARRHHMAAENERLRRLRERVESQEMKLRKLRALRGQVDQQRGSNVNLSNDLESIRALFNEKEKELSMAVVKVEELTRQLEELRKSRVANPTPSPATLELDKLRRELLYRNQLNEQQSAQLGEQRRALFQRQEEMVRIDKRIAELQQRLHRKRVLNQQLASQIATKRNAQNRGVEEGEGKIEGKPSGEGPDGEETHHSQDDLTSTLKNNDPDHFYKHDPKYQTLPYNTKFNTKQPPTATDAGEHLTVCDKSSSSDFPPPPRSFVDTVPISTASTAKPNVSHSSLLDNNRGHPVGGTNGLVSGQTTASDVHPGIINSVPTSKITGNDLNSFLDRSNNNSKNSNIGFPNIHSFPNGSGLGSHHLGNANSSPLSCKETRRSGSPADTQPQRPSTAVYQTTSTRVSPALPHTLSSTPKGILQEVKSHTDPNGPPPPPPPPLPPPPPTTTTTESTYRILVPETLPPPPNGSHPRPALPPKPTVPQKPTPPPRQTQAGAKVDTSPDAVHSALSVLRGAPNKPASYRYASRSVITSTYTQQPRPELIVVPSTTPTSSSASSVSTPASAPEATPTSAPSHTVTSPSPERSADSGEANNNSRTKSEQDETDRRILASLALSAFDSMVVESVRNMGVGGESLDHQGNVANDVCRDSNNCMETLTSVGKEVHWAKKGNLKTVGSGGKTRRVSFDPLALLLDASLEGEVELVKKTAREVPDPSASNDEGITALHNAICAGHFDIVKFLVEFGCDVNAQDSDGWTPLHCAASCNNLPMVKFLVEHGACIFATTLSDHETAAEKCEEDEEGFDGCSEYLYSVQEKLGIANNGSVYAVYDYDAQNADELTFRSHDLLIVLRKGDEFEREWWWTRLSDREGYVPKNLLGMYPRVESQKET